MSWSSLTPATRAAPSMYDLPICNCRGLCTYARVWRVLWSLSQEILHIAQAHVLYGRRTTKFWISVYLRGTIRRIYCKRISRMLHVPGIYNLLAVPTFPHLDHYSPDPSSPQFAKKASPTIHIRPGQAQYKFLHCWAAPSNHSELLVVRLQLSARTPRLLSGRPVIR